jgi:hypothetical protein
MKSFFSIIATFVLLLAPQADTIVVPNGYENREGELDLLSPFAAYYERGFRYQQLYEAAWFASLPPEGVLITEVRFRKDGEYAGTFDTVIPAVEVHLSTTSISTTNLSGHFSENIGANELVVFPRGSLHLKAGDLPAGQVEPFEIVIPLSIPFYYKPQTGNLLLDVRIYPGRSRSYSYWDGFGVPFPRNIFACSADPDSLGSYPLASVGYVTQFVFSHVPREAPRLEVPAQTGEAVRANGFRFTVFSTPYVPCVVEFSLDLKAWLPLTTNGMVNRQVEIVDPKATNVVRRFYRAKKG